MLEIVDTDPNEPTRLFVYGDGGLGKSTLIARAPEPVLVDVEKGATRLTNAQGKPIKRMKGIETWADLIEAVKWLRHKPHNFQTVGLDSATHIERLAIEKILEGHPGKSIITVDKGYGAGDKRSGSMHKELIAMIEDLRVNRNVHIIITGHQRVKAAKDPAMLEDYDTFEPKFQTGEPLGAWKEYVDATIFVRTRTFLKTSDEAKARALTDGTRVAFTTQAPSHYAKNRYGLPAEMEFTLNFWEDFMKFAQFGVKQETSDDILVDISYLTDKLDEKTRAAVHESVSKASGDIHKLNQIRDRLREITAQKGAN